MSVESNLVSTNTGSSEGSSKKNSNGKDRSGTTGGAIESRACAACKYQRRRCVPDCPLAPYFPAENQQQFLNAHKLFGLRNLCKVLKHMKPPQRDIAIKTMIIQANVRASDPVGGCLRLERELRKQIDMCNAELNMVLEQLAVCRSQAQAQALNNTPTGTNNNTTAGGDEQENGKTSNLDDALKFYNSMDVPPGYVYNGHHENAFDDIRERLEDIKPPVDGSISSEKMVGPRVEPETGQTHSRPDTDLKNAASQFSLRN